MRWLNFEFDFNVIAWNLLCSTHKLRGVLSKPTLVIKCQSLVVCFITKMSDDSCIWCHAPVIPRQEAVEWYLFKMASQIGKCGNMGYVQYNYELTLKLFNFICATCFAHPPFFLIPQKSQPVLKMYIP